MAVGCGAVSGSVHRMPSVGDGKFNLHFDPYDLALHDALAALTAAGNFAGVFTKLHGDAAGMKGWGPSELFETGAQLTGCTMRLELSAPLAGKYRIFPFKLPKSGADISKRIAVLPSTADNM
jgi:hypothetical protein